MQIKTLYIVIINSVKETNNKYEIKTVKKETLIYLKWLKELLDNQRFMPNNNIIIIIYTKYNWKIYINETIKNS